MSQQLLRIPFITRRIIDVMASILRMIRNSPKSTNTQWVLQFSLISYSATYLSSMGLFALVEMVYRFWYVAHHYVVDRVVHVKQPGLLFLLGEHSEH